MPDTIENPFTEALLDDMEKEWTSNLMKSETSDSVLLYHTFDNDELPF